MDHKECLGLCQAILHRYCTSISPTCFDASVFAPGNLMLFKTVSYFPDDSDCLSKQRLVDIDLEQQKEWITGVAEFPEFCFLGNILIELLLYLYLFPMGRAIW